MFCSLFRESNQSFFAFAFKNKNIYPNNNYDFKVFAPEASGAKKVYAEVTIAKAAEIEGVCAAKMSRYIKNKTIVNDYYYCFV